MSKKFTDEDIKKVLVQCFNTIDTDGSGELDSKEIFNVLQEFNKSAICKEKLSTAQIQSQVNTFIKDVDKNSDNKISKDEFVGYFLPLCRD